MRICEKNLQIIIRRAWVTLLLKWICPSAHIWCILLNIFRQTTGSSTCQKELLMSWWNIFVHNFHNSWHTAAQSAIKLHSTTPNARKQSRMTSIRRKDWCQIRLFGKLHLPMTQVMRSRVPTGTNKKKASSLWLHGILDHCTFAYTNLLFFNGV